MYVSLKKKGSVSADDMLELPMRELTLEQLKNMKVYHVVEGRNREAKFFDEDLADHQPFPELSEALTVIDEKLGFNIVRLHCCAFSRWKFVYKNFHVGKNQSYFFTTQ